MFEIELFLDTETAFMLNWVVCKGAAFWHWNCVLMLNWIVWNRTVFYATVNCNLPRLHTTIVIRSKKENGFTLKKTRSKWYTLVQDESLLQ